MMSKVCSSHNLSELEELTTELRKDSFALEKLLEHDFKFSETLPFTDYVPENFDLWYGLLCDRISLTSQHISDIVTWEKALRSEHDFNSDSSSDGGSSDGI